MRSAGDSPSFYEGGIKCYAPHVKQYVLLGFGCASMVRDFSTHFLPSADRGPFESADFSYLTPPEAMSQHECEELCDKDPRCFGYSMVNVQVTGDALPRNASIDGFYM